MLEYITSTALYISVAIITPACLLILVDLAIYTGGTLYEAAKVPLRMASGKRVKAT